MINIGIKIIQKLSKLKIMYIKEWNKKEKGKENLRKKQGKNKNKELRNKRQELRNKGNNSKRKLKNIDNLL